MTFEKVEKIFEIIKENEFLNIPFYFNELSKHINDIDFDQKEILKKDTKYLRSIYFCVLDIKKSKNLIEFLSQDEQNVFSFHMALVRTSSELLNLNNSVIDLEELLSLLVSNVSIKQIKNPGETLFFALGFVLGAAIKRGVNTTHYFEGLFSEQKNVAFKINNKKFFTGCCQGIQTHSTSLILNDTYIEDLSERYQNWASASKIIFLNLFKFIAPSKIEYIVYKEENLEVLNKLYSICQNSQTYKKFNIIEFFKDKSTINVVEPSNNNQLIENKKYEKLALSSNTIPLVLNENNIELLKALDYKENELSELKNRLLVYQSVFDDIKDYVPLIKSDMSKFDLFLKFDKTIEEANKKIINLKIIQKEQDIIKKIKDLL